MPPDVIMTNGEKDLYSIFKVQSVINSKLLSTNVIKRQVWSALATVEIKSVPESVFVEGEFMFIDRQGAKPVWCTLLCWFCQCPLKVDRQLVFQLKCTSSWCCEWNPSLPWVAQPLLQGNSCVIVVKSGLLVMLWSSQPCCYWLSIVDWGWWRQALQSALAMPSGSDQHH